MYRINREKNDIIKMEKRLFSDLHFTERGHLQEWIAKHPDVLGEDLLIIQKEYAGFNDTKERLDLLALDKDGGLVIIENKLDDTGRDVVWQALKYTSYCSTLTTKQVIRLYQEYLDSTAAGEDAKELLMEFLGLEDDDGLALNPEDQRIIFIANSYRKEVTSTALWLLEHDINLQCFRATPYSFGDDLFLQVEQIIPVPETAEFVIDAKIKEKEKKVTSKHIEESNKLQVEFWNLLKESLTKSSLNYLERVTAKPYYDIGFGKGNGRFAFCIAKNAYRVELYFNNDVGKAYFDEMSKYRNKLDAVLPGIGWQRLDTKKSSRIKFEASREDMEGFSGEWRDGDSWPEVIDWYTESMRKFYEAVNPVWEKVQKDLKR